MIGGNGGVNSCAMNPVAVIEIKPRVQVCLIGKSVEIILLVLGGEGDSVAPSNALLMSKTRVQVFLKAVGSVALNREKSAVGGTQSRSKSG